MEVERYLADIRGIDSDSLLNYWQWLLAGEHYIVFRATSMGDLLLHDASGGFHMLDMIEGKLRRLASSESELWAMLTERHNRKRLLCTTVVRGLQDAGVPLMPGQCYSPEHPPSLGGSLLADNLRPCDIRTHTSIMGQLHQQTRDLPPGTRISDVRITGG